MTLEVLQQQAAEQNEYWICPKTGLEMAAIPAGPCYLGRRAGIEVSTPAFSMARHPVTNLQWHAFIQDSGYAPADTHPRPETYLSHWTKSGVPPKRLEHHPVTWISFIDALHFTAWAGLSIPSEWHWEKAARGVDGRLCPWGDDVERSPKLAHVRKKGTAAVDAYSKVRTAFGCEQMIGNVSEFCLPECEEEEVDDPVEAGAPSETDYPVEAVKSVSVVPTGNVLPQPTPGIDPDTLIRLRGSCYLRKSISKMICSHRRRLSSARRNSWTSLRVAYVI